MNSERTREEREAFARLHAGDPEARAEIAERHLPLVRHLARRFAGGNESLEDLEQVGAIGLLNAIDRYDPASGNAFSTFAVPTILGEIRRHFRDRTWPLRVPRSLKDLALACRDAVAEFEGREGRVPTAAELADALGRAAAALALGLLTRRLGARDREILRLRFEEDLTQTDIAARVGLSQMHVSRLLRNALDELASAAEDDLPGSGLSSAASR